MNSKKGLVGFLLATSLLSAPLHAATITYTVNSNGDGADNFLNGVCDVGGSTPTGECTLRAALSEAYRDYQNADDSIIEFSVAGPINLVNGQLAILGNIVINAPADGMVIDAQAGSRVFWVGNNTGQAITLNGLTLTNALSTGEGGAIYTNAGTLELNNVTISNSETTHFFGGGGIYIGSSSSAVTINDSTITGNTASENGGEGGGVANYGTLTVNRSTFSNNRAAYLGGGIYHRSLTGTTLVINDSFMFNNSATGSTLATSGGAINASFGDYPVAIDNTEFYGNSANEAGALSLGGATTINDSYIHDNLADGFWISAVNVGGSLTLSNSTISNNQGYGLDVEGSAYVINSTISGHTDASTTTDTSGTVVAHGIRVSAGNTTELHLYNSTIAGNYNGISTTKDINFVSARNTLIAGNSNLNCSYELELGSYGYNLSDDASCHLTGAGDVESVDAVMGPLQDNGGSTPTYALLAGSPAIDAGNPADCTDNNSAVITQDQRGVSRPVDGDGDGTATCDIGSYEAPANNPPTFTAGTGTVSIPEDHPVSSNVILVEANDPEGDTLSYSILSGNTDNTFAIDIDSGQITLAVALDYETLTSYTLTVQVDDGQGNLVTGELTVNVTDVDETVATTASSGGGGGCTVGTNSRFDPVFPGLVLAALIYLGLRRKRRA